MAADENRRVSIFINGKEVEFSLKGISAEMRKMRNELRSMTIGTDEYNKKAQELRQVEGLYQRQSNAIRGVSQQSSSLGQAFGGLKSNIMGMLSPVGLLMAGIGAAVAGVTDGIGIIRRFEKSLDDLQAIVGLSANEMGFFRDKAVAFAKDFGEAPEAILEAFKLAGSAKPELLESKDALAGFTEQALILAKASGMEVKDAISSLTTIMNANGAEADQTARYINVLAAGSQKGAKEVDFLAKAMEKIGPVAATAGISIEQQTAYLELLGEKGFNSAETAGTNFRNFLLILQQDSANMTNGQLDMNKVFENYAPIARDAASLMEIFGKENVSAAQAILINQGRIDELTDAVTGTNTASEQAAIQMDNLDTKIAKLNGAWEGLWASMEGGDSVLSSLADALTWVVGQVESTMVKLEFVTKMTKSLFGIKKEVDQSAVSGAVEAGLSKTYDDLYRKRFEQMQAEGKIDEFYKKHVESMKALNKESNEYKNAQNVLLVLESVRNAEIEKEIKKQQELADAERKRGEAAKGRIDAEKKAQKAAEDEVRRQKESNKAENAFEGIGKIDAKGYDNELQVVRDFEAERAQIILSSRENLAAQERAIAEQNAAEKAQFEQEQLERWQEASKSIAESVANTGLQLANIAVSKRTNRELAALDRLREAGKISDEKYEAQKEKIEREGFARRKRLQIAEVLINGAVAASKTIAQFGMPAALPALALLGVQTAGQIAVIAAQEYGEGGLVYGPSHARGGVPAVMEGGEYVVRKKYVTSETLPFLEQMNQGRIVYMNMPAAVENTRQDTSGILSSRRGEAAAASSMDEIRGLRNDMREWQTQLEVSLPLRKFEKATDRKSRVEKLANVA